MVCFLLPWRCYQWDFSGSWVSVFRQSVVVCNFSWFKCAIQCLFFLSSPVCKYFLSVICRSSNVIPVHLWLCSLQDHKHIPLFYVFLYSTYFPPIIFYCTVRSIWARLSNYHLPSYWAAEELFRQDCLSLQCIRISSSTVLLLLLQHK